MYDAVVVGLGVMGSGALHAMARRGASVLGIEQFSLPHSRGSSHGHGRICRIAYPELQYSQMALASWNLWEKFEEEAGMQVIVPTGGIDCGPKKSLAPIAASLTAVGVDFELIDAQEVHRRFPGVRLPDHFWAIHTRKAGIIQASKSLELLRLLARNHGAKIQDSCELVAMTEYPEHCELTIRDAKGIHTVETKKLVLTPGSWLPNLLAHLGCPIKADVLKMGYLYFRAKDGSDVYDHRKMPVFIEYASDGPLHQDGHLYGTPNFEYEGLIKVGVHGDYPKECGHFTTAEDRTFDYAKGLLKHVQEGAQKILPLVDPEPVLSETCLYTVTRDSHFILDIVPNHPRIVVGGGGSGHAFKHGPIIGEILADLAFKGTTEWENEVYKLRYHLDMPSASL